MSAIDVSLATQTLVNRVRALGFCSPGRNFFGLLVARTLEVQGPGLFRSERYGQLDLDFLIAPTNRGAAIHKMLAFRQDTLAKREAGGILVGFRRKPHLEIVDVTTPAFLDKRSRMGFDRRDGNHQRFARKCWKQSNGYIDYLGEWHTHPERYPRPSPLDLEESATKAAEFPRGPILEVMVGTQDTWVGVVSRSRTEVLVPVFS